MPTGYTITAIDFDHSAATLPIPGTKMSHADYFMNKKKVHLEYPNVPLMITVMGRRKQSIHLPAECKFLFPIRIPSTRNNRNFSVVLSII